MKKKYYLFLSFIIVFTNCWAQFDFRDGYIIKLNRDTIWGKVKYNITSEKYESCSFKTDAGVKNFKPDNLLGYGFKEGNFYISGIVDSTFSEVLVTGPLSLYKNDGTFYVKKRDQEGIMLEKKDELVDIDGISYNREDNRWKGILRALTSDSPKRLDYYIDDLNYDSKDLTWIVVKYNKNTDKSYVEYSAGKKWARITWGATTGIKQSTIRFFNYGSFDFLEEETIYYDPTFGLVFHVNSPRLNDNIAFQAELFYTPSRFTSGKNISYNYYEEQHRTDFKMNVLTLPLSMKYSYPVNRNFVFIQGGFNYDIQLNSTSAHSAMRYWENGNVYPAVEPLQVKIDETQFGYWASAGYEYSFDGFSASLQLRFNRMSNMVKNAYLIGKTNSVSLLLIVYTN
ncbi:outer membrane beta-barrel protein [Saccharicrinis sp. FJH54]|uniref:outer membrane beta-barrel protein n=1 Tax=Saccharicrinis sp. FJH54 TaxID=3344665 RepID=UPI0035D481BD